MGMGKVIRVYELAVRALAFGVLLMVGQPQLTPTEEHEQQYLAQLSDLSYSPDYIESYWEVRTKTGERVRFRSTAAQQILQYEIDRLLAAGKPIRLKVLKARQQGISTYITALLQARTQSRPGHKAISIADKKELPKKWLDRGRRWYRQTPARLRPALKRSNLTELFFEEFEARYGIGSARGQTPGMGDTLNSVHCSELSNWPGDPDKLVDDLLPAVPKNDPDALVVYESTGEMEGDWWHKQVKKTEAGEDDWVLVFLPWFITEEYVMDPEGLAEREDEYTDEERDFCLVADRWARDNPVHAYLAGYEGITRERMAWRRWTVRNEFSGDLDRFKSKYPATVDEAFLGVGNMAIPAPIVRQHRKTAREPIYRVKLERGQDGKVQMVPYEGVGPEEGWDAHWCVWEDRRHLCEYAIGADVMKGELSDKTVDRSERDWAVIGVLNRRTLATVAEFRGQIQSDKLGDQMLLAGEYWNWAYMANEVNDAGFATLKTIRSYPYLLYRGQKPDRDDDAPLSKFCWITDPGTREMMITDWIRACREEHNTGFEGKITVYSEGLAQEEQTFIVTKTGKKEHRPGCHDDRLFAWMIAYQVHIQCPHIRTSAAGAYDVETEPARMVDTSMYAGGTDPGIAFEREEEGDGWF